MGTACFSRRVANLTSSPIRDILAVVNESGFISFAGGLPAVETFPLLSMERIPKRFLQYGPSEGDAALRHRLATELCQRGLSVVYGLMCKFLDC